MSQRKPPPDWERIEYQYRAGVMSVREIAAEHGVSHTAVAKRAKAHQWERDLKAKIKAKADAIVAKAQVSTEVAAARSATEKQVVADNAQNEANIRLRHRSSSTRSVNLTNQLLDDLEALGQEQGTIRELMDKLKVDEPDAADALALAAKMTGLATRAKIMKDLGDSLQRMIALERQAYGITEDSPEETFEQRLDRLFEAGVTVG